jgi:hypothetical protein
MTVCCQNLTLGALSSHSALSMLVGALFKMFGLFLKTSRIFMWPYIQSGYSAIDKIKLAENI